MREASTRGHQSSNSKSELTMLTARVAMDSGIEAVNRNADGYILKRVDVRELLAMVERQLKKQREDLEYSEGKVSQYIETRVKNLELEMNRNR